MGERYVEIWNHCIEIKSTPGRLEGDLIQTYYRAYMQTYLEREIGTISDISASEELGKFTQFVSALTAQEINYSESVWVPALHRKRRNVG